MGLGMHILIVNAGSSSIKFGLFDNGLRNVLDGMIAEIGGESYLKMSGAAQSVQAPNHGAAVQIMVQALAQAGYPVHMLQAAAHRVVHGGEKLREPCLLTAENITEIRNLIPLAPLHNPANLAAIEALAATLPNLPQYASFDTAFHATNPAVATRYAIPDAEAARGIRRYGFHGISYASLTRALPALAGALPRRVLALHLGNGASLCAILDGKSVATTMGYSPLEGLTMGTRTGSIDGNAVLRLAEIHGIAAAGRLLNRESGLLALGGSSDMRALHAANTEQSRFAISHFSYWIQRHAGSMIAAMGGLDALAFTGGIGENDADLRARVMQGLGWLGLECNGAANKVNATKLHSATSNVAAYIVPAREEAHIAAEALSLIAAQGRHA